jgi:hypothetical protein
MLTSSDILYGVILPFALSVVILLVAWRPWKRSRGTPAAWGGPLAAGAAFAVAFASLQGLHHVLALSSAIMWLFYIAAGFTLLGLVDASVRLPSALRAVLVFVAAVAASGMLLRFEFTNHVWDPQHGVLWLSAIALVTLLWWITLEQTAVGGAIVAPLAMGALGGSSALIIAVLVEQTTGQAIGAMTIAVGVAMVMMIWSGKASLARGTAMVVAGVGVSALAAEYFVSSLPLQFVLLLAFAPVMLWSGRVPAIRRMRPWRRTAVRFVLLLIPLGVAVVLAILQARRDATIGGGDPYSLAGPALGTRIDA